MRTKKTYAEMKEHLDLLQEKRKAKAMAKMPLKRSRKPLVTSKPMKRVSTKQAKRLANYAKLKKLHMEANPNCAICGKPAEDLHHRKGRGIYLDDPEWFLSVCRNCHDTKIHGDPKTARANGWLI